MNKSTGKMSSFPAVHSSPDRYIPPEIAQAPTAMTNFGAGMAAWVPHTAAAIFLVTGPMRIMPSECLGDAAKCIPKRPRSQASVFRTFVSASQAPHPPALTTRMEKTFPYMAAARTFMASGTFSLPPFTKRPCLVEDERRHSFPKEMEAQGQADSHSRQKTHRPRSITGTPSILSTASVGHAEMQCPGQFPQWVPQMEGSPANLPGSAGGAPWG